jgi:hypothetical protein
MRRTGGEVVREVGTRAVKRSCGGNEMMCSETALPEQRRHGGQFRPFTLAVVALVVVLGAVALVALHYRSHLLWRYEASRLGLHDVQAIPDRPMPDSPTPDGWLRYRVGCIEFSLPPELARNRVAEKNGASPVTFQHGSRAVVVALPTDASKFSDLLKTASELCPESQRFTMPKLRRACYQASSDDFRWSMTPQEVRWHAFCITTGKLIRAKSDGHTESFSRQDLDGIIHFGGERVVFDWQSNDRRWGSYMHFIDHGDKADPTWIRAVCQSLKVSNETETEHRQRSSEAATGQ